MVTRAAKDLLRNTIRTVDHHNRLLEEQEMWRQWELEQGLTMMVSDDTIRMRQAKNRKLSSKEELDRIRKRKKIEKYRRQCDNTKGCERKHSYWMKKLMKVEEQDPDRWGHGGYKSLYPEEFDPSSSKKNKELKEKTGNNWRKKKKGSRSREKKSRCRRTSPPSFSESSDDDTSSPSNSLFAHKAHEENGDFGGNRFRTNSSEEKESSEHCKKHHRHHRKRTRHSKHDHKRHRSSKQNGQSKISRSLHSRDCNESPSNESSDTDTPHAYRNYVNDSGENEHQD